MLVVHLHEMFRFLAWREGKAAGNSTVSEFKEELGSSAKVQSVYDEAMEALRSDPSQMASNKDVTLPGQACRHDTAQGHTEGQ